MLDSTHLIQSITSALFGLIYIKALLLYHVSSFPNYNTISSWSQTYLSITLDNNGWHSPSWAVFPCRSSQRAHICWLYHMAVYNIDRLISHRLMANKKSIKSRKIYQKPGKRRGLRPPDMNGWRRDRTERIRRRERRPCKEFELGNQRWKWEEMVMLLIVLISALICLYQIHKNKYYRQLFQHQQILSLITIALFSPFLPTLLPSPISFPTFPPQNHFTRSSIPPISSSPPSTPSILSKYSSADIFIIIKVKSMLQSNLQTQTKNILNNNQFNAIRRLGKGGFGHVLLATKATSSSTYYAIKCISKKKMIKDPQLKRFLLQEINSMAMLDHPNIVKLLKTFQEGEWYFLVMEYCDLGNLYNFQNKQQTKAFSLQQAIYIYLQILYGLEYIHQNNIIHRDIKLENIFIKKNTKNNNYLCKIGDFGLARPIDNEETAITNCGTEIYMAPEILSGKSYGKQADVWSLGVLFYYLLFGDFPFKGINILDQIKNRCKNGFKLTECLKNKTYFKSKKQEQLLNELFERLFEINPSKRISIRELRNFQMFRKDTEMVDELTTTEADDERDDKAIEWQLSRIHFIQRIVQTVSSYNFLNFYLATAFKFYINKVLLYFLSSETITSYKVYEDSNPKLLAQIIQTQLRIKDQLNIQYNLLLKNQHLKEPIDKFQDGFNTKVEDFALFKMAYRNTVGRVYQQAHKKLADNLHERTILKLKLFLCHIINRVFAGNVNSSIFPFYSAWVKKNNIKISERFYDFNSLEEWIKHQRPQNLQRSQDTINQMFYK